MNKTNNWPVATGARLPALEYLRLRFTTYKTEFAVQRPRALAGARARAEPHGAAPLPVALTFVVTPLVGGVIGQLVAGVIWALLSVLFVLWSSAAVPRWP
ncbi:MAG: hypothetical protein LC647_02015 [Beggiatoa sp.]|nr:hypothetical protein [Beggiatoa sp.]